MDGTRLWTEGMEAAGRKCAFIPSAKSCVTLERRVHGRLRSLLLSPVQVGPQVSAPGKHTIKNAVASSVRFSAGTWGDTVGSESCIGLGPGSWVQVPEQGMKGTWAEVSV